MSGDISKIDWKRLWQIVSGIHYETPTNVVAQELSGVSTELLSGIFQYKAQGSSDKKMDDMLKEKKQEVLLVFSRRVQELLEMETGQCWDLICFYLGNEYRGVSPISLHLFLSTDASMIKLLDDLWGFYSMERTIVLKIVKNIVTFHKSNTHPYAKQYKEIVDILTLNKLRDSYIAQLEYLISEPPPKKLIKGEFFDYQKKLEAWSERNAREIIEIIHILMLICENSPFHVKDIKSLFDCLQLHLFGRQQRYFDSTNSNHYTLLKRLKYSEVMMFLKCIDIDKSNKVYEQTVNDIIDKFNNEIKCFYNHEEYGPINLAWMIFLTRFADINENEDLQQHVRQLGVKALKAQCFKFMFNLVTDPMFQDDSLLSSVVRRTIYNLLNNLCELYDGDGSCAKHPYIYELLSELLSWTKIAKHFCENEEVGVRSLYNTLLETFPFKFEQLSMIAYALTKAGMGSFVKSQLAELPIFSDLYDGAKYKLSSVGDDEYTLTNNVKPYQRIDFTLPAGTSVIVMSRQEGICVHFRTETNYFNILQYEIDCLLNETTQLHVDYKANDRVRRVDLGIKYLNAALQRIKTAASISPEMVHPTEMCIDLLNKFKNVQNPPVALLANCLNVCTSLLPLVEAEICTRVISLKILPVINNDSLDDYKKYANGLTFDSSLVGSYLVDVEKKMEKYDFFMAYLGFLRSYTKLQRNGYFDVEIPGLVFLLREVYPHMHTWRFESQSDKMKIYSEIMGFIADILNMVISSSDKLHNSMNSRKKLLRNICVYSLLKLENGLMLLRFVGIGNAFLQQSMEMEINWTPKQPHTIITLVRLSMRILMQLLLLKSTIFKSDEMSPLEALIYTQPKQRDTLRIIPVVTSYMCNIFDRWLPILSCRLLKRIALEFNMSLLACLDMEPDQIRMIFLQKLPDELENDHLKIAILELVEACIKKQPGVTEAFFKATPLNEKRLFGTNKSETQIVASILTYLEDYLEAVGTNPETIKHILPSKIMNLFHSLWKHNMQSLIEDLTKKDHFWEYLCKPLFSTLPSDVRAFSQILNILAIEIFSNSGPLNIKLKAVLKQFFAEKTFEKCLDYIFTIPIENVKMHSSSSDPKMDDEMPEWLCRLQSFKGFLVIILKKKPDSFEIPKPQMKILAQKCLDVLVERAKYLEDLRPFILLAELYLVVLLNFKHSYTENLNEDRIMLDKLLELLNQVSLCYEDLHVRAKEACVSIAIRSAEFLSDELANDSSKALSFLHSVVHIICTELQNLENCVRLEVLMPTNKNAESQKSFSNNSLILCLNLLKTVATIFHNDGKSNWDLPFITNKIFQRLLSGASSILPLYNKQNLSLELMDVLIIFAKGNCSAEFLHCEIGDYLWLKLLPPKEILESHSFEKPTHVGWTVKKWWPLYARGIELVTVIFEKHNHHFLKETLEFVGIHEQYIIDSLLLAKQSLEPAAVDLIKRAVMLLVRLVKFETQWRLENPHSLFKLMRSVQLLLGHCITIFHQPKTVKSLLSGGAVQLISIKDLEKSDDFQDLVKTFNDLTEIITLCSKCLLQFSPSLIDLICEPELLISKWEPLFSVIFAGPKLNDSEVCLSLLFSIISILVKVLNLQNFSFHEILLNELPNIEGSTPESEPIQTQSLVTASRTMTKSISVVSTVVPSYELLSNLDAESCLLALENVLLLTASQCLLILKNPSLPAREKQLIRRDISSELLGFHEFVKKKVLSDHRSMWHRRKYGQVYMQKINVDEKEMQNSNKSRSAEVVRRYPNNSMRVNVLQRMHLQHKQQQTVPTPTDKTFEMSHVISPINAAAGVRKRCDNEPVSSTPQLDRPPLRRSSDIENDSDPSKRAAVPDSDHSQQSAQEGFEEEEIELLPPEEPTFSPLSYVQLVEEDYLHFMHNLFIVIAQSD